MDYGCDERAPLAQKIEGFLKGGTIPVESYVATRTSYVPDGETVSTLQHINGPVLLTDLRSTECLQKVHMSRSICVQAHSCKTLKLFCKSLTRKISENNFQDFQECRCTPPARSANSLTTRRGHPNICYSPVSGTGELMKW